MCTFICDLLQSVKCVQDELARKYIDPATAFALADFQEYNDLLDLKYHSLCMKWKEMPSSSGVSHLYFDFKDRYIYLRCHDKSTGQCLFVTREQFHLCIENVQRQFAGEISLEFFKIISIYFREYQVSLQIAASM